MALDSTVWPRLMLAEWQDTHDTIHMWMQIVGKTRLALAPRENHWWHVPLYVTARGLVTSPIPYRSRAFDVEFDLIDHRLVVNTSDGATRSIALRPQAVADFYREYMGMLTTLGISVKIWPVPVEVDTPIPFLDDRRHASYDAERVQRFFYMLLHADRILKRFKGRFLGKASPVHFFWGAFDLTATRHNGEPAPVTPGEGYIRRVAENEANWAAGFWPGGGPVDEPVYYAYMVPSPEGFARAWLEPADAVWNTDLGEFLLPYEAVRTADDPAATLMAFLQSSYVSAADLAGWDRERLELKAIPRPR